MRAGHRGRGVSRKGWRSAERDQRARIAAERLPDSYYKRLMPATPAELSTA